MTLARLCHGGVKSSEDMIRNRLRVSSGKRSRVATALRMAANSLHRAKDYLGKFFRRITRRITRKLGNPQAITATAHKLARIVYHLLSTREAYNESVF